MCVRGGECVCVCVCVCEREAVCVCVCVRERERDCVCVRERERERVCVNKLLLMYGLLGSNNILLRYNYLKIWNLKKQKKI